MIFFLYLFLFFLVNMAVAGIPMNTPAIEAITYILVPFDLSEGRLLIMGYILNIAYSILFIRPLVQSIGEQMRVKDYTLTRARGHKLALVYVRHMLRRTTPVLTAKMLADAAVMAMDRFSGAGQFLLISLSAAITVLGIWTLIAILLAHIPFPNKTLYLVMTAFVAAAQALAFVLPAVSVFSLMPTHFMERPFLWIAIKMAVVLSLAAAAILLMKNQKRTEIYAHD